MRRDRSWTAAALSDLPLLMWWANNASFPQHPSSTRERMEGQGAGGTDQVRKHAIGQGHFRSRSDCPFLCTARSAPRAWPGSATVSACRPASPAAGSPHPSAPGVRARSTYGSAGTTRPGTEGATTVGVSPPGPSQRFRCGPLAQETRGTGGAVTLAGPTVADMRHHTRGDQRACAMGEVGHALDATEGARGEARGPERTLNGGGFQRALNGPDARRVDIALTGIKRSKTARGGSGLVVPDRGPPGMRGSGMLAARADVPRPPPPTMHFALRRLEVEAVEGAAMPGRDDRQRRADDPYDFWTSRPAFTDSDR